MLLRMTARLREAVIEASARAAGYVRTPSGLRNQDFVSATLNATGDGSLYMSLDDWSAWIAAMDRRALLSKASWNALWERTRLSDGQLTEHGFCFDHVAIEGHEVLEFDGSWQGFLSAIERDPGQLAEEGFYGTTQQVIDRVGALTEFGVSRVYFQVLDLADVDHLELIAREVMPHFA